MTSRWREIIRESWLLKIWIVLQCLTLVGILIYLIFVQFHLVSRQNQAFDTQYRLMAQELLEANFNRIDLKPGITFDHSLPPSINPSPPIAINISGIDQKIRYSNIKDNIGTDLPLANGIDPPARNAASGNERWKSFWNKETIILTASLINEQICQRCHSPSQPVLGYARISFNLRGRGGDQKDSSWLNVLSVSLLLLAFSALSFVLTVGVWMKRYPKIPLPIHGSSESPAPAAEDRLEKERLSLHLHAKMEMMSGGDKNAATVRTSQDAQYDRFAMMGELMSGLAHELRNPIAGISAAIQTLSRRVSQSDPSFAIYQEIRNTTERVDTLVRSLLSFARSGQPKFAPTQVNDIILESLKHLERKVDSTTVVRTNLEENLPLVYGDEKLLQQVFINLCVNALEANRIHLELEVSTHFIPRSKVVDINLDIDADNPFRCTNGVVQVRVKDNGPGIPPKDLANIFKPFFTTKEKGTGFGLYFSTQIVRQHHGCLFARNNEGEGASFVICLPIIDQKENDLRQIHIS